MKYYNNFNISVNEYYRLGKNNDFPKPEICPFCKIIGTCLIGWGYYQRWATTEVKSYWIDIKIVKCTRQTRGGYISIQPTFMIPYKQHVFKVIYYVLKFYLLIGMTMKESLSRVFQGIIPGYQIIQAWKKSIKKNSGTWIGILQSELKRGYPKTTKNESPVVYLMRLLEMYFEKSKASMCMNELHGRLLKRYRGSPLTHLQIILNMPHII